MISNLRLLFKLGAGRRLPALLGLATMAVVGAAFEVIGVGLVFPLISLVHDPGLIGQSPNLSRAYQWVGADSTRLFVTVLALVMAAVFLAKSAYMALLHYLELKVLAAWKLETSRQVMEGYLHGPYQRAVSQNSAEPVRTVATLVPKLFGGFVRAHLLLAVNVVVAVGIAGVTIVVEPMVALVALALPLLYLQNRQLSQRLAGLGAEVAEVSRKRQKTLQQSFGAIKEIKVLGRETHFLREFGTVDTQYVNNKRQTQFIKSLPSLLTEAILTAAVLLLIIIVVTGDRSPGNMLASLGLLAAASFRLLPVVNRIVGALNTIKHGEHSARIVVKDLAMADRWREAMPDGPGVGHFRLLQLENVSFAYPNARQPALHNVNLTIRAGESVGLAGPSGAGKTSLADLILGLFEPTTGCFRVNGVPVRGGGHEWRESFGFVPQSIYLLDDTVRRNVAFGVSDEEIDDQRVWRALEEARLSDHILWLPHGLDAILGEHGARLSAGQRQRVGIARALYRDPDLLVLDEATSSLDDVTENEVANAIGALKGRKTLIVIAHRRATLRLCDRLVFLREGRIESIGTPSDLPFETAKVPSLSESVAFFGAVTRDLWDTP